jgi:hypothetical protein
MSLLRPFLLRISVCVCFKVALLEGEVNTSSQKSDFDKISSSSATSEGNFFLV